MPDDTSRLHHVVASDVGERDGIGVEVSIGERLVVEIFRNDATCVREVTLFEKEVPLEVVEEAIEVFRREIPEEYIA